MADNQETGAGPPPNPPKASPPTSEDEPWRDRLLLEDYRNCLEGYNSRDTIVPTEFNRIVQTLSLFAGLMLATNYIGIASRGWNFFIHALLGAAGTLSLLSLTLDLAANASCKKALRRRCSEISKQLTDLKHWEVITQREMTWIEKKLKGVKDSLGASDFMVWSSYGLLVLWIFLMAVLMCLGHMKA